MLHNMSKLSGFVKNNRTTALCILFLIFTGLSWISIFISRGGLLHNYFHTDSNDMGMDFFNVLAVSASDNIYAGDGYNYPPFCMLMMKALHYLVPAGVPSAAQMEGYASPAFYLRVYQNSAFLYLVITSLVVLLTAICVITVMGDKCRHRDQFLACAVVLLSGPFLFMLERGNTIMFALVGTLIFVALYNSESRISRVIACVSLVAAASIKLYPAIFSVILIKNRCWKEFLLFALSALICFFPPFFAFGGISAIKGFIVGLSGFTDAYSNYGMGIQYSLKNMCDIASSLLCESKVEINTLPLVATTLVVGLFAAIRSDSDACSFLVLGALCVVIPSISYTYAMTFLIPGLICLLTQKNQSTFETIMTVLALLCLATYTLPIVSTFGNSLNDVKYPLYYGCLIGNLSLLGILIASVINALAISVKSLKKYLARR